MTAKYSFLRCLATYSTPTVGRTVGIPPLAKKLSFVMQPQTETQWCWAAVSTSVSKFFSSSSVWTQCKVANCAWQRNDCCGSGSSGPCNKPWYLDRALNIVGVLKYWNGSVASFTTVQSEITNLNPVCIRVGWSAGGGHFLSIVGWFTSESGQDYYDVDDPIYGAQRIARNQLETNYLGSGTWTHSYFVDQSPSNDEPLMSALSSEPVMGA